MNGNHVSEKVLKTIEEHNMLDGVRHLVLGFSGGPDSICLFHLLLSICEERGISLHPVHINHGIRKGVCDEEEEFCRRFAEEKGLTLRTFRFDCEAKGKEWGLSTEEAGRRIRYESFFKVAGELASGELSKAELAPGGLAKGGLAPGELAPVKINPGVAIAVAQNRDDQVETVLMRIIRGTGITGLSGISHVREDADGFRIIRPLLDVPKEDILNYCMEHKLNPRMDETNLKPIYQRNKIRLDLIPYLRENYNGNIDQAILRLAESAEEERDYIEKEVERIKPRVVKTLSKDAINNDALNTEPSENEVLKKEALFSSFKERPFKECRLDNSSLRMLDPVIRKGILVSCLKEIGLTEDMTYRHFMNLEAVVFSEIPSAHTDLPGGYYCERRYEDLLLGLKEYELKSMEFNMEVSLISIEEFNTRIRSGSLDKGEYAAFDFESLVKNYGRIKEANSPEALVKVRNKMPGDTIKLKVGTKKIQDLLVDSKIPMSDREKVIVSAIGSNVLWVMTKDGRFMRWSTLCPVRGKTQEVLLLEKVVILT